MACPGLRDYGEARTVPGIPPSRRRGRDINLTQAESSRPSDRVGRPES
ncbi:hypothetical protein HMPREF9946_02782 [Acetobacteraceae bacterium AT-5844]|nr:hypothetical protein HMPREF9946_02782 [Acetobacteraceae bacterium AT-5844]